VLLGDDRRAGATNKEMDEALPQPARKQEK
jgi:hypothetical protein